MTLAHLLMLSCDEEEFLRLAQRLGVRATTTAYPMAAADRALADLAAGAGILSSAAMVDLYGQIYAQDDITGDWAAAAEALRTAYVGETPKDRMAAIRQLWDGAANPQARIDGFTVQAMVQRPQARELIVGIAADAVFGPVLLCGAGGVDVELRRQSAVALPPLTVDAELTSLARDWAQHQADAGHISHANPISAGVTGYSSMRTPNGSSASCASAVAPATRSAAPSCDWPGWRRSWGAWGE